MSWKYPANWSGIDRKGQIMKKFSIAALLIPLFCGCINYNNGIDFQQVDRRQVVTFEPFVFSSAGHKISSFGSQWGYPGFAKQLDIRFTLNLPANFRFDYVKEPHKVPDAANGVLRVHQKIPVCPPEILDESQGIDLNLRVLNSDIVIYYEGKVKGRTPGIDCCFLPDGTPLLDEDIELFAAVNPTAGKAEFHRAMREKYDFDPTRKGNGRKDYCGNDPYYYLVDGTPVYAYDVQAAFALTEKNDAFFQYVRQMNRGKPKLICKIDPLLGGRYGLEYHPPEFHPAVTTELPEFFEFCYLSDRRYRNTLWDDIPKKDAYKEIGSAEFAEHWQKAWKDDNYVYQAVTHRVRVPEIPEIVKQRGFAVIFLSVYNGRVLVVFSRLGDTGTGFYQTGMPHYYTDAETFFEADPRATAEDFLNYIHRKNRFSICPEFLWKSSDHLPYCRINGELFCYRYIHWRSPW